MSPTLKSAVPALFLNSVMFLAVAGELVGLIQPSPHMRNIDDATAPQQVVASWASGAVPKIVSLLGSGAPAEERKLNMSLIERGAALQVPNWIEWSSHSNRSPEVAFKVAGKFGPIQAEHLSFSHTWLVHVPGVLTETSGNSSYQVALALDVTVVETRTMPGAFFVTQLHARTP
jgi:hypothetical protein